MPIKHNALDISSFFIKKEVSPLKLQKLLYYSQVWFFVKYKQKLFNNKIQAWIYGPVVYDVWDSFRYMKRNKSIPSSRSNDIDLPKEILNHLESIWSAYGHLNGSDLVELTHGELPWRNSRKGLLNHSPSEREVLIDSNTTIEFELDHNNVIPLIKMSNSFGHYSNV